jgi:hypothetical protein
MAASHVNAGDPVLGLELSAPVEIWQHARTRDLLLLNLISGALDTSKLIQSSKPK